MQIHSSGSAFSALKAAPKAALQFGNADAFARFQTEVAASNMEIARSLLQKHPKFTNRLCDNGHTPFGDAIIGAVVRASGVMDLSRADGELLAFKVGEKPTEDSFQRAMREARQYVDMVHRKNLAALREFEASLRAEFGLRKRLGGKRLKLPVTLPTGL